MVRIEYTPSPSGGALVEAERDARRDVELPEHDRHQARELLAEALLLDEEVGERLGVVPVGHIDPVVELAVGQVLPDRHHLVVVVVEPGGPEAGLRDDRGRDRGQREIAVGLVRGSHRAQVVRPSGSGVVEVTE